MAPAQHLEAGSGWPPDIQHQQMIGLIDELRLMILSRDDRHAIAEIFDELDDIAISEFAREDREMRNAQAPGHRDHQRRHQELTRNLRTVRQSFGADPDLPKRDELYDFLSDLLVHTLFED